MGRPKKEHALREHYKLRFTEEQKELIHSAGTAEYWRNHMIKQAKVNLGIEVEYPTLEEEGAKNDH